MAKHDNVKVIAAFKNNEYKSARCRLCMQLSFSNLGTGYLFGDCVLCSLLNTNMLPLSSPFCFSYNNRKIYHNCIKQRVHISEM